MGTATRPHILCICTVQRRFDAVGADGDGAIRTPAIDGLVRGGVLFERCCVQRPVCDPARAGLIAGRSAHTHGPWLNGVVLLAHLPLFPRVLADAGSASSAGWSIPRTGDLWAVRVLSVTSDDDSAAPGGERAGRWEGS